MDNPMFMEAQKLRDNGNVKDAISLYKKVRINAQNIGDLKTAAECLHMIGVCYYLKEDFVNASQSLNSSLEEFRKQKDIEFSGFVLRDLGLVSRKNKQFDNAKKYFLESIKILHNSGNSGHEGISHSKLGLVYADLSQFEKAVGEIKKGIKLLDKTEDKFFLSSAYLDLANVMILMRDKINARKSVKKSLEILNSFASENEFLNRRKDIEKLLYETKK